MDICPEDIALLTINNVLLEKPYNDLGLLVGDRLLILVEAQATWTVNVLIRLLLYLAQTYLELIVAMGWNVYGTKPMPELYVLYTGPRKARPKELRLSTELFGGKEACVEVRVKVLYGGEDDIIGGYVTFCRVLDEQYRKHGYTAEAVRETIRICRDKGVLEEHLHKREKEVIDIMLALFDQEVAEKNRMASVARAARADERQKTTLSVNLETIKNLMETLKLSAIEAMDAMKIPPDQQAVYSKLL